MSAPLLRLPPSPFILSCFSLTLAVPLAPLHSSTQTLGRSTSFCSPCSPRTPILNVQRRPRVSCDNLSPGSACIPRGGLQRCENAVWIRAFDAVCQHSPKICYGRLRVLLSWHDVITLPLPPATEASLTRPASTVPSTAPAGMSQIIRTHSCSPRARSSSTSRAPPSCQCRELLARARAATRRSRRMRSLPDARSPAGMGVALTSRSPDLRMRRRRLEIL